MENTKVYQCGQIELKVYGDPIGRRAVVRASDSSMSLGSITQLADGTFEMQLRFDGHEAEIYATFEDASEAVSKSQDGKPWHKYGQLRAVETKQAWLGAVVPVGGDIDFGSVYRSGGMFYGRGKIPSGPFLKLESLMFAAWEALKGEPLVTQKKAVQRSEGTGAEVY